MSRKFRRRIRCLEIKKSVGYQRNMVLENALHVIREIEESLSVEQIEEMIVHAKASMPAEDEPLVSGDLSLKGLKLPLAKARLHDLQALLIEKKNPSVFPTE